MQTQKPSKKDLRSPMASTKEPTITVKRVMAVDQAVTMRPARASEYPRSEESQSTRVEFMMP